MRPTSDQSKKASGTFTPARTRIALGLPIGVPDAPQNLSDTGKMIWNSLVPDIVQSGVVARADWVGLGILCELAGEWYDNPRELSAGKLKELRLLLAEFGCSVSARLKIKAPEAATKTEKWTPKPAGGKVVSISRLLSDTPKGLSPEASTPADMSASPASDS